MIGDGRELGPRAQNSINHGVQCFPRGHALTTAQGSGSRVRALNSCAVGPWSTDGSGFPAPPPFSPLTAHSMGFLQLILISCLKKKKRLQWLLRPTLKCWSDSLAWHSGCWEILGLMSSLATFNALGLPIGDTYSHLWAFVQAFYLEGCSSPTFCSFGYLSLMLQVLY